MNAQNNFFQFKMEYSMKMNSFKETVTYVLSKSEIWMSMCQIKSVNCSRTFETPGTIE